MSNTSDKLREIKRTYQLIWLIQQKAWLILDYHWKELNSSPLRRMHFFECGNIDLQSFVLIFFYGKRDEKVNIFLHTQDCFDISSTVIGYTRICILKLKLKHPFPYLPPYSSCLPSWKMKRKIPAVVTIIDI